MQRKKLLKLPINKDRNDVPQMQAIVEEEEVRSYGVYKRNYYNYCYDAFIDNSTGEDVLILDVYFTAPQAEFLYRLFQTEKKWFTVDSNNKTSGRSLMWTVGGYWDNNKYHPFNDNTDKVIDDFIKKHNPMHYDIKGSGIIKVRNYQDKIRQKNNNDKYERIKNSISREMMEIRPIPKSVYKWIDDVVMADSRYMFYDYNGKKHTTARCSVCGETVTIPKVKKGEKIACPHCKKLCKAMPRKAFINSSGIKDEKTVIYLQPFKNNKFCARTIEIKWLYCKCELPLKKDYEIERTIVEIDRNRLIAKFYYEKDEAYKGGDWRRVIPYYRTSSGMIFPGTLNKIFKERPDFNKYHIDFAKIVSLFNPTDYIGVFDCVNQINCFNNLISNNLINLAKSIITSYSKSGNINYVKNFGFNLSAGSLRKSLNITKDDLPYLKVLDPDLSELQMYFTYKATKRKIDVAELKECFELFKKMVANNKFLKSILKYSSLNQFIKFCHRLEKEGYFDKRYSWHNPYSEFRNDYEDYLEFAELLEYNLKDLDVLYPKNLKEAHDTAANIIYDEEFRKGELPQIAKQYENYKNMYYFETEEFLITPPKRHNEVKEEGSSLKHCVASYAKSIATEKTVILFIRKKSEPNKPYFTLELNPENYKIKQCRGLKNCAYPDDVKKFMDKWYKTKIEPLRKENIKCQKTTAA